jgi:hypothetical protein
MESLGKKFADGEKVQAVELPYIGYELSIVVIRWLIVIDEKKEINCD